MKTNKTTKAAGVAAMLIFVAIIVIVYLKSPEKFWYDSSSYAEIGDFFATESGWPTEIRGVCFPILLFVQKRLLNFTGMSQGQILAIANVTISLLALFFVTKHFDKAVFKDKNKSNWVYFIYAECVVLFILLFFQDNILQPLSDLPAALSTAAAITCALKAGDRMTSKKYLHAMAYSFLTGALLYFAYNTRTIYLFSAVACGAIFILANLKKKGWTVVCTLCILAGAFVTAIPQMKTNYQNIQKYSPMIETKYHEYDSLFTFQLYTGLQMQRYDTFVGNLEEFPADACSFADPIGQQFYDEIYTRPQGGRMIEYIKFLLEKPVDMAALYFRHFVNMLSCFFFNTYIPSFATPSIIPLTLFFIFEALVGLMFIFIMRKEGPRFNFIKNKEFIFSCSLIIAGLLIIPGAVEFRFSIPIVLPAAIALVIFIANCFKDFIKYIKQNWFGYSILICGFYCFCLMIWSSTLSLRAISPLTLF